MISEAKIELVPLKIVNSTSFTLIFTAGRAVKAYFLKSLALFLKTGVIIQFCSVIHKNLLTDNSLSIGDPGELLLLTVY